MTAGEISDRIVARLDDSVSAPGSVIATTHPPPEVLMAINEAQELFALMTLCLETTLTLTLTAYSTFVNISTTLPDYLVPLRLSTGAGRVRPATLADLDAENTSWQATSGTPLRYATLGFNLLIVTPQPTADTSSTFRYARSPLRLVNDTDVPEIPLEFHQCLADYGVYRVKLKEGGQQLQRGMKYLNAFMDEATRFGNYVRQRSLAARLDTLPFELALYDRSRLINKVIQRASIP